MSRDPIVISRRAVVVGSGALIFSFAAADPLSAQQSGAAPAAVANTAAEDRQIGVTVTGWS